MTQMADKVAIVTGGGSGMGRASSVLFAQEGAAVAVADLNEDGGQQTVAMIEQAGGLALSIRTLATNHPLFNWLSRPWQPMVESMPW